MGKESTTCRKKKDPPHLHPLCFPHKEHQIETELLHHRWDTRKDMTEAFSHAFDFLFQSGYKPILVKTGICLTNMNMIPDTHIAVFVCFSTSPSSLPYSGTRATATTTPELEGFYLPMFHILCSRKSKFENIKGSPETESMTMFCCWADWWNMSQTR